MNFLAHLYLSGDTNDNLKIGNFIGDQISGNKITHFHPDIQKGIRLHRAIDTYTDNHAVTARGRERLYPTFHKYAGVITDVYYDHFLAKHWARFSKLSLADYATQVYLLLESRAAELPEETQRMLVYMKLQNWLLLYASVEGITGIFERMAKRTRFISHMELAGDALKKDYALFEADFFTFFPDLEKFCAAYIKELETQP